MTDGSRQAPADYTAPPNSPQMEMAVIGCLVMYDAKSAALAADKMDPVWFYTEKNRLIFKILTGRMLSDGVVPDIQLTSQWLTNAGVFGEVGGTEYLANCMEAVSTLAHVEAYISELRALYYDRQIRFALMDVNKDPSPENIEKLRAKREEKDGANAQGLLYLKNCRAKVMELMSPLAKGMYDPFGMEQIDKYHNGSTGGDITVIAARPGVGKTALVVDMAVHFATTYAKPVLMMTTEMTYEETLQRLLPSLSGVPGWKFRKRYFDKEGKDLAAVEKALERLENLNIVIVDRPSPTLAMVRAAMAATQAKLVIIDYLQVLNLEIERDEGRPAAFGRFMYGWKESLRGLGAQGIALSQMDREVDHLTKTQRPQLADLKGSGDIEQIANAVYLMWKHNKKDRDTGKPIMPEIRNAKPVEIIAAKNRTGTSDVSVQLVFDENYIKFHEWSPEIAMKYNDAIMAAPKFKKEKKNEPVKHGWDSKLPGADATTDPEEQDF